MPDFDQWLTPPGVAGAFMKWAKIGDTDVVLEPAAGEGALIPPNHRGVVAFEIDPERADELRYWKPLATIVCADFLQVPPIYNFADVCIQNPPYSDDGEGTFLRRALQWAPRCCGLLRAGALQGAGRFEKCWKYVRPTRIGQLVHRPHFEGIYGSRTKHTPQYDFIVLECVLREQPLEREDETSHDVVEMSWLFWR